MADDLADPYANLQASGVVKKDQNAFPNPYDHLYAKPPVPFSEHAADFAIQVPVAAARALEAAPSFIPKAVGAIGGAVESAFPSTAPDPAEASQRQQLLDLTAGSRAWMQPLSPHLPDPQNVGGQIGSGVGAGITGMVTGSPMALPRSVGVGTTAGLTSELAGQAAEGAGFPGLAPGARAAGMLGAGHVAGRMAEGAATRAAIGQRAEPGVRAGTGLMGGIEAAANRSFDNFRASGFSLHPAAGQTYTTPLKVELAREGFTAGISDAAKRVWSVLDDIERNPFTDPVQLQSRYKELGKIAVAAGKDPEGRMAARIAQERLLTMLDNPPSWVVQGGDPAVAGAMLREANANWAALKRAEGLEKKITAAELRAGANYSGMNLENELRRRVGVIGDPNTPSTGFSAAEQQEARRFAQGGLIDNARRWGVNLIGGRGGLGQLAAGTAATALVGGGHFADINPLTAGGGAVALGMLGAKFSNMRALQNARNFELNLLRRSPYAQAAGVPATNANVPYSMVAPTLATLGDER